MYYRDAQIVIFVYSVIDHTSFERLTKYVEEVKKNNQKNPLLILIGNKTDLLKSEEDRSTDKDILNNFILTENLLYYEVSSKTGDNCNEVFETIIIKFLEKILDKKNFDESNRNISISTITLNANLAQLYHTCQYIQ